MFVESPVEFIIEVKDGIRTTYDVAKDSLESAKTSYDTAKDSLETIAQFFKDITWIVGHPYEVFKIFMMGVSEVAMVITFVIVVASLFMYIADYKGGLKYAKISIAIFLTLKIVAASL